MPPSRLCAASNGFRLAQQRQGIDEAINATRKRPAIVDPHMKAGRPGYIQRHRPCQPRIHLPLRLAPSRQKPGTQDLAGRGDLDHGKARKYRRGRGQRTP